MEWYVKGCLQPVHVFAHSCVPHLSIVVSKKNCALKLFALWKRYNIGANLLSPFLANVRVACFLSPTTGGSAGAVGRQRRRQRPLPTFPNSFETPSKSSEKFQVKKYMEGGCDRAADLSRPHYYGSKGVVESQTPA